MQEARQEGNCRVSMARVVSTPPSSIILYLKADRISSLLTGFEADLHLCLIVEQATECVLERM